MLRLLLHNLGLPNPSGSIAVFNKRREQIMTNIFEGIKSKELSKNLLGTLFQGTFKNLLQFSVTGLAQQIPFRYYKISGIISGALVASLPFVLKFFKKKYWVFYLILGTAEIFVAVLAEKQKERSKVFLALQ
jgi:uncharacterized membrane protein